MVVVAIIDSIVYVVITDDGDVTVVDFDAYVVIDC